MLLLVLNAMIAFRFSSKKQQFFKAKRMELSSLSVHRDHLIFRDTEQLRLGITADHC